MLSIKNVILSNCFHLVAFQDARELNLPELNYCCRRCVMSRIIFGTRKK